jgi:hypothetical protein
VGSNPLARADAYGAPQYDCGLDGISLRKSPWPDLAGWMARYLAEEEQLFAAREAEARRTVDTLAGSIARFRTDTGALPRSLAELFAAPEAPPRDPWGQSYRYDVPGRFNPGSFDVYSVHGHSRAPGLWIGNWTVPYAMRGAIEGETLAVAGTSPGVRATPQELRINAIPPLSGGALLFVRMSKQGDWVDLQVRPPSAGRYRLAARLVTSHNYAVVRCRWNGEPVGDAVNCFSPKVGVRTVMLGTVACPAEGGTLRLEVVDRDALSSDYYAGIDAVVLEAEDGGSPR